MQNRSKSKSRLAHTMRYPSFLRRLIPDLAALFFLLLLVAFFFWRLWAPNPEDRLNFPRGDFTDQYYPLRHFVAASYAEGRIPFWNPYIFGGQPGLADPQAAALYPPALLNAFFWGAEFSPRVLQFEVVAHIALAACGAYLFVRLALRLGIIPALLAAVVFAFGGYLPGFPIQQVTILETLAWLPWLLLTLHHAAPLAAPGGRRLISAALASLVLACALLAGHPQSVLYLAYLSGFYVLLLLILARPAPRDWLASVLPLLLPFVLGVGLATIQLLPTLAFIEYSSREDLNYEFVQRGLQWKELLDIVLPKILDSTPLYVGILPLLLAGYGLLSQQSLKPDGQRGQKYFWGGAALVSLLLALGGSSPFFELLYLGLPYLDSVRSQERVLIIWNWSLALLAAWGIATLLEMGQSRAERARLRLYVRWLANFIPVLLLPLLAMWWLKALEFAKFSLNLEVFLQFFSRYSFFTFIFVLAWGLLAWFSVSLGNDARGKTFAGILLIALVLLDLFSITRAAHFGEPADKELIRYNEVVETLKTLLDANNLLRVGIVGKPRPRDNDGMYWGFPLLSGNEPLRLGRTENFMDSVGAWRQFQLFSTRYVVADTDLSIGQPDAFELLASASSGPESYLLGVRPPMPYAWVVTQMEQLDDREAAYKRLNEESFDPYMIALRREEPLELTTEATSASVTVLKRTPGFAEVHVTNPSNGSVLLIFAEPYLSDWQVLLDGTPRRKLAVNEFNLSITIPPGEHSITINYEPAGWQTGLRISAVSLLIVLIMFSVGLWQEGRAR